MSSRIHLVLGILVSASAVLLLPGPLSAQQRIENNATAAVARAKAGSTLVGKSGGLSLYVRATKGRLLQYSIRDPKGRTVNATMERKGTTCWACGVDASGDRHCWQVPCPDIVGPWIPKDVKAIQ
jgi:hypothetical protein